MGLCFQPPRASRPGSLVLTPALPRPSLQEGGGGSFSHQTKCCCCVATCLPEDAGVCSPSASAGLPLCHKCQVAPKVGGTRGADPASALSCASFCPGAHVTWGALAPGLPTVGVPGVTLLLCSASCLVRRQVTRAQCWSCWSPGPTLPLRLQLEVLRKLGGGPGLAVLWPQLALLVLEGFVPWGRR